MYATLEFRKAPVLLLFAILAIGCVPRAPQPTVPVSGFPADFPQAFYSAAPRDDVFRVVTSRSSMTLKVYRTGALASLGHNHVVESREIDGFIYLSDDLGKARADLFVPVAGFVVDDAAARAAAGPDFATQPSPSDIEGTRANMLGPRLLDAQTWPYIVVHVAPLHVGSDTTQVQLIIKTRDHVTTIPVDAHWRRAGSELTIESAFKVDHATLGLEPFSALGGAMRVADQIDVAVSITATTTN